MEKIFEFIKEHFKIVVIASLSILTLGIFYVFSQSTSAPKNELTSLEAVSTEKSSKEKKGQPTEKSSIQEIHRITVDLKGAVRNPAVYQMPSDSRVDDLIKQAGGFLETADPNTVNLAAKLKDEEVIYVATKGEKNPSLANNETKSQKSSGKSSTAKVNINKADLAEIQTLKGVGAKRAQDIIDYREANGPFKSLEDLGKVAGFGEKSLEKLKDSITFD